MKSSRQPLKVIAALQNMIIQRFEFAIGCKRPTSTHTTSNAGLIKLGQLNNYINYSSSDHLSKRRLLLEVLFGTLRPELGAGFQSWWLLSGIQFGHAAGRIRGGIP